MELLTFLMAIYMIPTLVAGYKGHQHCAGIAILNLFLGWTLVGWIVALIWAVTNPNPKN